MTLKEILQHDGCIVRVEFVEVALKPSIIVGELVQMMTILLQCLYHYEDVSRLNGLRNYGIMPMCVKEKIQTMI